jgi:hypothetical protein
LATGSPSTEDQTLMQSEGYDQQVLSPAITALLQ